MTKHKIPWSIPRKLFKLDSIDEVSEDYNADPEEEADINKANLVSSQTYYPGMHAPVLDLDVPHYYVPSSTEGHGHLYIDVPMTWEQYQKLMDVLAEVGILEEGYVGASKNKGYSALRLPWIKKKKHKDPYFGEFKVADHYYLTDKDIKAIKNFLAGKDKKKPYQIVEGTKIEIAPIDESPPKFPKWGWEDDF